MGKIRIRDLDEWPPETCGVFAVDKMRRVDPGEALYVVSQPEFFGMGFQARLPAPISDIVWADVVPDQRDRNDNGNKPTTIVPEQRRQLLARV
jgi:hypothetical protein